MQPFRKTNGANGESIVNDVEDQFAGEQTPSLSPTDLVSSAVSTAAVSDPSATPVPASSPLHYFIKIDGVKGDATVNGSAGWLAVDGFDWGLKNSSTVGSATGGAGAGKATFSPLTIDIHSLAGLAALFTDAASGRHVPSAELVGVESVKGQSLEVYKVDLTEVLVGSFQEDPGAKGVETTLGLDFAKIKITDQPQTANGKLGTPETASWDLTANTTAAAVTSSDLVSSAVSTAAVSDPSATPVPASSPLHYFIKIDGVKGDATVNGSAGWLAVDGFDWGLKNSSTVGSATGGAGAGKATFSPLTIDIHSLAGLAALFTDAASGRHVPSAELVGVESVKGQSLEVYKVDLTEVLVGSFQQDPGAKGVETTLGLDFAKIKITDQPQTDGKLGTPETASWDLTAEFGCGRGRARYVAVRDAVMSDWGQGYHVGTAYTRGFYPELAPSHLETALLFAGLRSNLTKPGARYCELGCGYGLTTLVLAAANPHMTFVGVDFNPTHIVAARTLANSARLPNIRFVEASFDELLEPRFADLGEFDIIALHGIYSWVAPSVRRAIVEFADARLKTGGALYVSYNAAPGWMPRAPLQRFIFEYAKRHPMAPRATTAEALRFAKTIKDAGALYFQANPPVAAFIKSMLGQDLAYLVHENLNESWSALYHADVVEDFAATRLSYACAAQIADDIDETSIPITTHDVVAGISDGVWRETVKDFLVGRSFRRDIFVRGPVELTPAERSEELDRQLVLTLPRSAATPNIKTAMGEVKGRADIYSPILDRLAAGPVRLPQLVEQVGGPDRTAAAVIQALGLLIHSGQVKMVRADTKTDGEPARRLNVVLAREVAAGRLIRVLAAPAVGTGVGADLCDFGFVVAREKDLWLDAETIARTTWKMIEKTTIRPMRDGKLHQQESEALAYLHESAERLLAEKQGVFETLGI